MAHKTAFFWGGVGLIALFYLIFAGMSLARQPLGFDEGWDLQAPLNLAEHGQYASMGAAYDGKSQSIDPFLSTGPAVLMPVAIVFKFFGVGAVQARLVIMAFYIATIFLLAWYVYDRTKSGFAIIAPLAFLSVSSPPVYFRLDILGEMPAIAYGLASLIAWRKARYGLAGTLMGLAVLSKVIMFFLLFAGAAIFCLWLVRNWRAKWIILLQAWHWILGAAVPLVAWEIFKFAQLGGFHAYKHNWHLYINFFRVTGSGIAKNGNTVSLQQKWSLLTSTINVQQKWWLVIAAVLLGLLLYLKRRHLLSAARINGLGLLFVAFYLCWWFALSNGNYVRYVVPVAVISVAIGLALGLQSKAMLRTLKRYERWAYYAVAGLLLAVAGVGVHKNYFPLGLPPYSPDLALQKSIAQRIATSHPTTLTHIGWWQNPEVLFLGDLHSTDEQLRPDGSQEQLLLSPAMRDIDPKQYIRGQKECTKTYFADAGYVYCLAVKTPAAAANP